jgi:hypothetical protein
MNLIGGEQRIKEFLGIPSKNPFSKYDGHFLDDEEFDE